MKRIFTFVTALFICLVLAAQQGSTFRWKQGDASVSNEAAFRFTLDGLAPGNYIIKVFSGQELLESLKLIKK